MQRRRHIWIAFALAAAVASPAVVAETKVIVIEGMQFRPATLTVHRGDTVVWRNQDLFPHNVTTRVALSSGEIGANQSWKYTAKQAGRLPYVCTLHPTMTGVLVVE